MEMFPERSEFGEPQPKARRAEYAKWCPERSEEG